VSADENQVVINLPDGNARTFGVRPEDAPRLGSGTWRRTPG
jgi:hypothetical protein